MKDSKLKALLIIFLISTSLILIATAISILVFGFNWFNIILHGIVLIINSISLIWSIKEYKNGEENEEEEEKE